MAAQIWAVGIIDRVTGEIRIRVVGNDRSANTLIPYIVANVQTNEELRTIIFTDGWRAYGALEERGYDHRVVIKISFLLSLIKNQILYIHELGFGRGRDTTNHIESAWACIKRLSGFYNGFNGTAEEIQIIINYGIWRYAIRNLSESEQLEELLMVFHAYYDLA